MQFAEDCCQSDSKVRAFGLTHLDDDKLSSAIHLTRFGLPNSSSSCIHTCPKSSYNSPNHHAWHSPTTRLDDCADTNNSRSEYDLPRASKDIASPYCAHSAYETANVIDRSHDACIAVRSCVRATASWYTYLACLQRDSQTFEESSRQLSRCQTRLDHNRRRLRRLRPRLRSILSAFRQTLRGTCGAWLLLFECGCTLGAPDYADSHFAGRWQRVRTLRIGNDTAEPVPFVRYTMRGLHDHVVCLPAE
jgi:hypothetical protein